MGGRPSPGTCQEGAMRPRGVPRVRRAQSELRVLLAVVQGVEVRGAGERCSAGSGQRTWPSLSGEGTAPGRFAHSPPRLPERALDQLGAFCRAKGRALGASFSLEERALISVAHTRARSGPLYLCLWRRVGKSVRRRRERGRPVSPSHPRRVTPGLAT